VSISAETSAGVLPLDHVLGPPLRDNWAGWRRVVALACAVLLHATVIALLLLGSPFPQRAGEPPSIPVELVLLPERKPPPKPKPELAVKPAPEAAIQPRRESGGDPDLAPGRVPDAAPQPKPEPAPAASVEKPPPSLASAPPLPVPPPRERPKASEAVAAVAPTHQSTIQPMNDSALTGKGGGDRYLNKVRDNILGNLIYPGAARSQSIAGVAQFEIIIDRQGHLLQLRLRHSSGADMLDRAGRDAVELSAPFGPPPPDVVGDQIGLELTLYIGPEARSMQ